LRPHHNVAIAHNVSAKVGRTPPDSKGKPDQSPNIATNFETHTMLNDRAAVNPWQRYKVFQGHGEVRHVLPDEQELISSNHSIDKIVTEPGTARPAMLMHDVALGPQQALPAPFPGLPGDVRVLDIKRIVQRIEASNRPRLPQIHRARPASRPKHRNRRTRTIAVRNILMPEPEEAALKFPPGQPGFLSSFVSIRKENLGRHRKDSGI